MKNRLAAASLITLLAACSNPIATEPPPPIPPPDTPLMVTVRDYHGTNGNATLALIDIVSNREATLDVTASCTLSNGVGGGFGFVGYSGRITVETRGSDRTLEWDRRGAPDATARTIQCNSIIAAHGHESVSIYVR